MRIPPLLTGGIAVSTYYSLYNYIVLKYILDCGCSWWCHFWQCTTNYWIVDLSEGRWNTPLKNNRIVESCSGRGDGKALCPISLSKINIFTFNIFKFTGLHVSCIYWPFSKPSLGPTLHFSSSVSFAILSRKRTFMLNHH